jgi:hypothetical protein
MGKVIGTGIKNAFLLCLCGFLFIGCDASNPERKGQIDLLDISKGATWTYSIQEMDYGIKTKDRTRIVTIDSVEIAGDSIRFGATEVDTGFQMIYGYKKDTTVKVYVKFNGSIRVKDTDGAFSPAAPYFWDSLFEADELKTYADSKYHFHYFAQDSVKNTQGFGDTSYVHRLLYVENIGLVELTDNWTSLGGYSHSGGNSIKLKSFNGDAIDYSIFDSLK